VGCVDSKATKILAVAPCAVCACRERRVELSERGNNRTNRTRCRGQYSRSKRLFLTPPPCVRYCLLHNCPSLSPPHATANPIVFALWPTPSSTTVWGLLPKMPISTVLRVKYLLFILPRVPTDSLYLTKTVFTYISFPPKFGIGILYDVCKPTVVWVRRRGWRVRERGERNRRNQFPSETTLGLPRVIVINHMGSKMRFWQMEQRHRYVGDGRAYEHNSGCSL